MAAAKITHEQLRKELEDGSTTREISNKYNMSLRAAQIRVQRLRDSGFDPANNRRHKNPENQIVAGYSTLVRLKEKEDDSLGAVLEWVKTSRTAQEILTNAEIVVKNLAKEIPHASPRVIPDLPYNSDIIPWYCIGDAHIGLITYEQEVGHNFDLTMAKAELLLAMKMQIDKTEPCDRCVINDAGDALHYDSAWGNAKTSRSGHDLQQSGTFSDMMEVYVDCLRYIIDYALTKHKNVDVIINQGNHSRTCDLSNRIFFERLYEKEPRVNIIDNRNILIPYRMGNTFIVNTHTDNLKPKDIVTAASVDYRQDYGECHYRYVFGGHLHHYFSKDLGGAIYYSMNNLAPNDQHGAWGGWRSRNFLTTYLMSKTYGERGRFHITAEEVQDILYLREAGTSANLRSEVYTV